MNKVISNSTAMADLVRILNDKIANAHAATTTKRNNKIAVWKLIDTIKDPNSPIIELSNLAGHDLYPKLTTPSAGITCAIIIINQRPCLVIANNPRIKAGSYFPITVKKHLRALEIALTQKLPCIYLVDSAGIYLPMQAESFPDHNNFGKIFYYQAQLSAAGIPQISVVLGSCTAGGAYIPAMSEHTIMLKNNSHIFLAGPPLVAAATGEQISADDLGGAHVHTTISGLADYQANDPIAACQLARNLMIAATPTPYPKQNTPLPNLTSTPEIYAHISSDLRHSHDFTGILTCLTDPESELEFKPQFGPNLYCGYHKIAGINVAILANQGILDGNAALKGTQFIQMASKQGLTLLFLQNISGFSIGKHAEHNGIAKHGAKMVMALATATCPKITLLTGGSYGAGNYAMAGRAYNPDFLWAWPNARTAVMGGTQAALVLENLSKKKNDNPQAAEHKQHAHKLDLAKFANELYQQSSAYYGSARLWDDGIIDPATTRQILALALTIIANRAKYKTDVAQSGIMRQ